MEIISYTLKKLPGETRSIDLRIKEHVDQINSLGEREAIANRLKDGSLVDFSVRNSTESEVANKF